jgi:hypothetical protein
LVVGALVAAAVVVTITVAVVVTRPGTHHQPTVVATTPAPIRQPQMHF